MTGIAQKKISELKDKLKDINNTIRNIKNIPEGLLTSREYHRDAIRKLVKNE